MKKLSMATILLLPLVSAACGGASAADLTSSAREALNSGDSSKALKKFEQALEQLTAEDPGYMEAKMGAIEARIEVDAEAAKQEFLELAKARPDEVVARDYSFIGGHMGSAAKWSQALEVVHAGIQRYGEAEPKLMALLESIKVQAKSNPTLASELAGMGYL